MEPVDVIHIATDLLLTAVILSLPAVLTSLTVGIVISVLQTMTSIQEQTLTFAPRIIAVALVLIVSMPWSLRTASAFTVRMMVHLTEAGR
ncbi:MAG: flagellar biosynthetic protein FliQ [Planctomycetaceae bacterium]